MTLHETYELPRDYVTAETEPFAIAYAHGPTLLMRVWDYLPANLPLDPPAGCEVSA